MDNYSKLGQIPSGKTSADVLIIGGGPAGLATALAVKKQLPNAKVLVLERTSYTKFRPGETVPGPIREFLEELDIWEAFKAQNFLKSYGTTTFWGNKQEQDSPALFHLRGNGWHLNRPEFDQWMVDLCRSKDIEIFSNVSWDIKDTLIHVVRGNESCSIEAQVVVDATGSRARYASKMGAQPIVYDKLNAFYMTVVPDKDDQKTYTKIESSEFGWWYSCRRSNDRVIAFFTDDEIARKHLFESSGNLTEQLKKFLPTEGDIHDWFVDSKPNGPVSRHIAKSQIHSQMAGSNWISVGDATICYDPLSGQGIYKGFHTAMLASFAIYDYLEKKEPAAFEKYSWILRQEFNGYQKIREAFYKEEQRWPRSEFWSRRSPSITISPQDILISSIQHDSKTIQWLSASEQSKIVETCKDPCDAATLIRTLSDTRKEDSRLILGVQEMLKKGLLLSHVESLK
ncbi:MAG: NAD(P)/FAD-dependent oxidoreductase [Crocinitomicaceae bacterium]|nr:NAD(P)/FAD-dependent oxidoreductase [Flavobacteriales bacterium]NQZ36166.1 NAD(P)/FAD-dependent oxidoreductase [Crocinitomicaceae bacterium]